MGALQDWIDDAHSLRKDDLVYFNYIFESNDPTHLLAKTAVDSFEQFLESERHAGKTANYLGFLRQFVTNRPSIALSGGSIAFPKEGVVSIFSAGKAGRS